MLNVWAHIEQLLTTRLNNPSQSMQVVRLKPKDGKRIVGVLIPQDGVNDVLDCLARLQEDPNQFYASPAVSIPNPPLPASQSPSLAHHSPSLFHSRFPQSMGGGGGGRGLQHSYSTSSLPNMLYRQTHQQPPTTSPMIGSPYQRPSPRTGFRERNFVRIVNGGGNSPLANPQSTRTFSPRMSFTPNQQQQRVGTPSRLAAAFQSPNNGGYSPRQVTPLGMHQPQQRITTNSMPRRQTPGPSRLNWASPTSNMFVGGSPAASSAVRPGGVGMFPNRQVQIQQQPSSFQQQQQPQRRFGSPSIISRPSPAQPAAPVRPKVTPKPLTKVKLVWKND